MQNSYDITRKGKVVGTVWLKEQGLYYCICCRCHIPRQLHRIYAFCGDEEINLGIPVPEEDTFVLTTKLAKKLLSGTELSFCVRPIEAEIKEQFIPIYPDEPFAYLQKLRNAYLELRGNQLGCRISK